VKELNRELLLYFTKELNNYSMLAFTSFSVGSALTPEESHITPTLENAILNLCCIAHYTRHTKRFAC